MSAAQELENLEQKMNWHWRNTMRVVRFFNFDARAAAPLPILLVYARLSTIALFLLSLAIFRYFESKGLTTPAAMRNFRQWVVGKYRPGWPGVKRRKFQDFG